MAIKSLLLLLTITLLFSSSSAHNITRILSKHPKFSIFNSLLSSTNLAKKINHRHSITVLAVSNDSIGGLIGLSPNIQRRILSVHVILDYFDREKLQNLKSHSTIVPTLFQTSGIAKGRTGFLNITKLANGQIAFSSAASGAHHVAKLVGQIAARPYSISVIHSNSDLDPPGIDGPHHNNTPPSSFPPAPTKADAPVIKPVAPVINAPVPKPIPTEAPATDSSKVESPKGAEDGKVKSSVGRVAIGTGIGAFMGVHYQKMALLQHYFESIPAVLTPTIFLAAVLNRYISAAIAIRCNDILQRFKNRRGRHADFSSGFNRCKAPE